MNETLNAMPHSTVMQCFHYSKFSEKGEVIILISLLERLREAVAREGTARGLHRCPICRSTVAIPRLMSLGLISISELVFGLFKKSPLKKSETEHKALFTKELHAQRNGDLRAHSFLTARAETISEKIDVLKAKEDSKEA